MGRVSLPVTFDTEENFRTEYLSFEVADFKSSYHAILGRPCWPGLWLSHITPIWC
jgi:hypothetical protein